MDGHVDAHLEMVQAPQGLSVSAYVRSEPPGDLRWRLEMTSRNAGGTSNVSQAGRASGTNKARVGHIVISPNSQGTVTLLVFEGETEVAADHIDFGQSTENKEKTDNHPE